jgi:hypothetical protein
MATDIQTDDKPPDTLPQPDYESVGGGEVATLLRDQMRSRVLTLRARLHRLTGTPFTDDTGSNA